MGTNPLLEDEVLTEIWLQWDGEPDLWYGRFRLYVSAGRGRKISHACMRNYWYENPHGAPLNVKDLQRLMDSQQWYTFAKQWHWAERAEAYDRNQDNLVDAAERDERARARAVRRTVLSSLGDVVHDAIPHLGAVRPSWTGVSQAVKVLTDSSREEYDDLPTSKSEQTITVKEVQQLTITIIAAFNEANELDDPNERRAVFAKRLEEISIPDSSAVA